MRMKKLMILAVAAIALVACSRTFEHHATEGAAIGFNTWAEHMTKARAQGASAFTNGDSFVVEGFKTVSSNDVNVFDNVTVSTTDGSTWTYTNTRYWDSNASSYTFFAVSSPTTTIEFEGDGTINATAVTFSGKNNDILLANSVDVAPANFKSDVPVAFTFKHLGALVDLKVKKTTALDDATVEITAISIEGVDDEATVAVSGYTSNVPTVAWGSLANEDSSTYTNASGVTSVTLPNDVSSASADALITSLIVIPQSLSAATKLVKISYTITDNANNVNTFNNKTVALNAFDLTDYPTDDNAGTAGNQYNEGTQMASSWVAGTHYIYTLTIDANAINFTGTITDWTDPATSGYYYLVN